MEEERFNLPFWVHLYCFMVAHIGFIPLYFGYSHYHFHYLGIDDESKILFVALISSLSLLFYGVGVFTCRLLQVDRKRFAFLTELKKFPQKNNFDFTFGIALFLFSALIFSIYLFSLETIPIVEAVMGHSDQFSISRSDATNNYAGILPYHYFEMFFHDILFFSCFFWIALYFSEKSRRSLVLLPLILVTVVFASFVTGEKAPFVWFSIGMVVTLKILLSTNRWLNLSRGLSVILGVGGFFIVVGLVSLTMKTDRYTPFDYLRSIGQRITIGAPAVAYFQVELAQMDKGYLEGRTLPNPRGFFPFEPVLLPIETKSFMNSRYSEAKVVGSAPGPYWAELFANFGALGVCVISFIVGFLICCLSRFLGLLGVNCLAIAVIAWSSTHFIKIAETGIGSFVFDQKTAFVILLAFGYFVLRFVLQKTGVTSDE